MRLRLETLGDARRFATIQEAGRVRAHRLVLARFAPNEGGLRWAFSTGRRLGGAVVRNRVRRRLREGVRALQPRVRDGWDIMLVARPESAGATSAELHAAIVDVLRRGSLLVPEGE